MDIMTKNMLTLADLYFTDGKGNFRFQWSNQALVNSQQREPQFDDDHYEYFQDLAKYEYVQEHLNDGSNNAVSYRVNIYNKKSGKLVATQTVNDFDAEFALGKGQYLWEVEALDVSGRVITKSEKAYFYSPDFDDYDNEAKISYKDSSANHQIAEIETCYDSFSYSYGSMYVRLAVIGKIISGDNEAYFSICGPAECGSETSWDLAEEGGYMYPVSNAFGGFPGEFFMTENCLLANSGIYVYENGQWNYKYFTQPEFDGSGSDYIFVEDDRTIYQYDVENNTLKTICTSPKDIYMVSGLYYATSDGIFSIEDSRQILSYNVKYGEHLLYDDLFFNIFAKDTSGQPMDVLENGEKGSVVVKYFFIDNENNEIIEQEQVLFKGRAWGDFDTEEIFESRVGNCICFAMQDENFVSNTITVFVHEIQEDYSITRTTFSVASGDIEYDCTFTTDSNGKLIFCYNLGSGEDKKVFTDIEVNFDFQPPATGELPVIDKNGISFTDIKGKNFTIDYSLNNFASVLRIETEDKAFDTYGLPAGKYSIRISANDGESWQNYGMVISDNSTSPEKYISDTDGKLDVFFVNSKATWTYGYFAQHNGFIDGWTGTKEQISLNGKNKIADVFAGSEDDNILILTDDANGDALFIDDIYTGFGKDSSRLSEIKEIRAGAGDDIIDMTSQRYAYIGSEMTVRGGDGDDVIWANGSDNDLFGDAGNDRIIGSAGFDVIAGGAGDDIMVSGGGDDIFTFCENWGNDTVEITDNSNITLWFKSGDISKWNAEKRIYRDGNNSVKIIGGKNSTITLKFGDEGGQYEDLLENGAFAESTDEKIFVSVLPDNGDNGDNENPVPGGGDIPAGNAQYFGTVILTGNYDNYTDKEMDDYFLRKAVVNPLQTTAGNDIAIANRDTWSYFEAGIDFGAGDDKLIVSSASSNIYISGVWVNGELNFGEGDNTLETSAMGCVISADNIYFGNGNNTVKIKYSEVESGKQVYDEYGEHIFVAKNSGKIIFGDGQNNVVIDGEGEFQGSLIQFGDGGNNVILQNGGCLETESYYEGIENYEGWWDRIEANGGISRIVFGSGNDKIELAGVSEWGDKAEISTFELDMGGGDDSITLNQDSSIYLMSCVDKEYNMYGGNILMGEGNDTFTLNAGAYCDIYGTLDMGSGDDTMVIGYGAWWGLNGSINFGEGNDSLILDGELIINSEWQIGDVENISGNGSLIMQYYATDEFIQKFEDAGITVTIYS